MDWSLRLPEERRHFYEQLLEEAESQGITYWTDWFGQAVNELLDSEPDITAAWSQLCEEQPLLQQQVDPSLSSAYEWLDEDEWLDALGWKQDEIPFRTCLQLVEPEGEGWEQEAAPQASMTSDSTASTAMGKDVWQLKLLFQDKRNAAVLHEIRFDDSSDGGFNEGSDRRSDVGFNARPHVRSDASLHQQDGLPVHWLPYYEQQLAKDTAKLLRIVPMLGFGRKEQLTKPVEPEAPAESLAPSEFLEPSEPSELTESAAFPESPGDLSSVSNRVVSTLTDDQAWVFMEESSLQLLQAGYSVLLPSWWEELRKLRPKLKAQLKSSAGAGRESMVGLSQIMQFDWRVAVGDIDLTEEEFMRMASEKKRLMYIRGRWIQLDPAFYEQVRQAMKQMDQKQGLSFREVLELHLLGQEDEEADAHAAASPDHNASGELRIQVELNRHMKQLMKQLQQTKQLPMVTAPSTLQADLRHYQLEGLSWLVFLRKYGLGGCLADDMGLGKTIQFIAYLLHIKEQREQVTGSTPPALLICPTSVLGNWQKELQRFAPTLQVHLHYGSQRAKGEAFAEAMHGYDLVITSYSLAHLDEEELSTVQWDTICLDEAQNIKNAYTKQSAAIRKLGGNHRIALTGTPIENRLSELWSIFDFINPGYLGSLRHFTHHYVNPVERTRDEVRIGQVQKLVRPFLLRRLKKDPAIQLDLPDKNEMKAYVSLTTEQGALYENVVQSLMNKIETLSGMEKKGLILATLTKLKQICNHPALLLKETGQVPWEDRSTKMMRLLEMIDELRAEGDNCLIFTQFVHMGHLLQTAIEKERGEAVQFLHGGVPKSKRDEMIARFQDTELPTEQQCGIFILSLKAGGTGLNLTAANHVFHFDRWWNPAVENQATDRAFRIGQTKDVQVHKFVTLGTLEERIDEMIERKQGLSQQIIGSGENWVTEMSTDELREMFTLRKEWSAK
ncbi:DEAD/DEAH box helicase [Paenibacillus sp. S3N08]|uniref:DEAD/DEAH box helicase n=2 Tax=Paenibacillus agricola TaxID=2716264 RepID=A0ABX0JEU2_9BACL|nr:DEAD/DEAH box helicase [Paenibacillus agricola]